MPATATAGRIEANDIDELEQVVRPWDVILRQMSPGRLHACMDYITVNGIVLYREHWSRRIIATGATPPGFFVFAGPLSPKPDIGWCGGKLTPESLAFGRPSSDIDFATPNGEAHICLLVPEVLLLRYLGAESAKAMIPNGRFLSCHRGSGVQMLRLMEHILDKYFVNRELLAMDRVRQAIEWQLLGGVVELLLTEAGQSACLPQSARYLSVLNAMELCENSPYSIPVHELALAAGVSKRVLELGFREIARTTPREFMRWSRLNRARKELLAADRRTSSVTQVASNCGITELGRFAVNYKRLFGESPSTTLSRRVILPARTMSDLLSEVSPQ